MQAAESIHSSYALFVATVPPHGSAARVTLRQLFSAVLGGAEVDTSLGSARAAVVSLALTSGLRKKIQLCSYASVKLYNAMDCR